MNLAQIAKQQQFIGLFVGKNGSGKSGAAASFAELGPVKLYDLDERARGILGIKDILGIDNLKKIEVVKVAFEKGWAEFDKLLEMDLVKQKNGQFPYKTVILDSAANLQKFLVSDSQRLRGSKGKSRGAIDFWTPDDYNYCSSGFFAFFYEYARKLGCNFIMTGWMVDRYAKPEATKENADVTYAPNEIVGQKILLTEKLAEEVPGYFDEVYTFEKEEYNGRVKYFATFESTLAKTCHPALRKKLKLDFTDKSFYTEYSKLIAGEMDALAEKLA